MYKKNNLKEYLINKAIKKRNINNYSKYFGVIRICFFF